MTLRGTCLGLAAAAVLVSGLCAAQANAYVYWSTEGTTLGQANLDGTGVDQSFVTGATSVLGVAVDSQYIYWINNSDSIGRANLDGTGTANQSFITGISAVGLAVSGQYIYWADPGSGSDTGAIGRANLDGTGVDQTFITSVNNPVGVAVNGHYVYWSNFGEPGTGSIGRANLDGTTVNQSFITGTTNPGGVAVNGQYVYWTNGLGTTIGRANLDGTGVNENFIATGPGNNRGVAVDGQYIYWGSLASDEIGQANLDGSGTPDPDFISASGSVLGVAVDDGPAGTATPNPAGLDFATQPLDTYSPPQTVTITDSGDGQLQIGHAQVSAGDTDDFLITTDTCSGTTLWPGDTCTIDIRFGPTATSADNGRIATLTLPSNDPAAPLSISLKGTGGSLPQGPAGVNGTNGTSGTSGTSGTNGTKGTSGTNGTNGATGPAGPAGEIELVTCKPVTTGRRNHKKTVQSCTTQMTSSPVKLANGGPLSAAILVRGGLVYAIGSASRSGKRTMLALNPRRTIHPGSYTLKLSRGRERQRETITIG